MTRNENGSNKEKINYQKNKKTKEKHIKNNTDTRKWIEIELQYNLFECRDPPGFDQHKPNIWKTSWETVSFLLHSCNKQIYSISYGYNFSSAFYAIQLLYFLRLRKNN